MSTRGTSLDSSTLPVSDTQDTALSGWCGERVFASDTLHEMRRWLPRIVGAIALVAILFIGLNQAEESKSPTQPKVSKISSAELHAKLDGAPPALAALHREANDLLPGARKALQKRVRALRGHPVVINVWAAWCGPCRVELPVFQSASLDWGKRVAFLGVDLRDNRGAASKLLGEIPLTYPSYEDPDGKVYNGYHLVGTPSTIYYDASGKQTYIHTGPYEDREQFDADIKRYAVS
jgi:cytochrome c biogenesis protein CcmG, thiol:disulfide interchange protein DsbE